jgi:integrase
MARARWRQRDAVDATTPITVAELRAMSRALPATLGGLRDRAAILVGYGGALRPSELVALGMADVSVGHTGLRLATARGVVHVPFGSERALCAVTALEEWTRAAGLDRGPVLRAVDRCGRVGPDALGEKAVGRIVRRAAAAAGLPPERFTGLSLRRGMVAAAAARGSSRRAIMRQTGHRSERVVRGYVVGTGAGGS